MNAIDARNAIDASELDCQIRPQEMVIRGHAAGERLRERINASDLSWILDPLIRVPSRKLNLWRHPPGQVNCRFPFGFMR